MIRKLFLTLFISASFLYTTTYAQSIADINSPKVLPPSPDAAALGKYAQIPVDKSTGIPEISIPLYEIKTARFSLPISVSYHASGIKVDELASWVGIGWSLNASGVVTRSMVGIADEFPGVGYMSNPSGLPSASTLFNNLHADSAYMEAVSSGQSDSQPDNFFYNFAGQSGAFMYQFIGGVLTAVTIPYKPVKVSYNAANQGSFTIVDENGNSYWFNDKEMGYSTISAEMTGATSWYLSQMISADKTDTIKFTYTTPVSFTDVAYSFSQNLGPGNGAGGLWPLITTTNQNNGQQIYLKTIQFKGGKVDFIGKTGRKDNGALALDSIIVSNYDYNAKKYTRLKSFKILTDYFHSTYNNQPGFSSDSASTYRLRLSGLIENDQHNLAVKTHQFAYNTTQLPPVHNFGQDKWGYFNGQYTNRMLLEAQNITTNQSYASTGSTYSVTPIVYTIGNGQGANRSVSATYMQAGILQKIIYPTGGYSTFSYEPNKILSSRDSIVYVQSTAVGFYSPNSTTNFTPTQAVLNSISQNGSVTFHIHINATGAGGYSNNTCYAMLMQGSTVLTSAYATTSNAVDEDIAVILHAGVTYQLVTEAIGGTSQTPLASLPQAYIQTSYHVSTPLAPTNVGGLRVTSISNYDSNNALLSTETYKYGVNRSGIGDMMTNPSFMVNYSTHIYVLGQNLNYIEQTYSNNSVYPLSSLNGSPVGYEQVTVFHGDSVQNIGKSVYNYAVAADSLNIWNQAIFPKIDQETTTQYWQSPDPLFTYEGVKLVPRLWQNGDAVSELHYANNGSGQYTQVQSKFTTYSNVYRPAARVTSIAYGVEFNGYPRSYYNSFTNPNMFSFYDYPISIGTRVPVHTISTTTTSDTVNYYYGNHNHMLPTRIVSYDGRGDSIIRQVNYPQDMVAAGLDPNGTYAAMTASNVNIISPVIQVTQLKNATQMLKSVTAYSSTNGIYNPQNISLQVYPSATAETRLNYQYYNNGNLQTVFKTGAPKVSYIWGYGNVYPVAQATNASANDIFFENFEDDGSGNSTSGDAKTGNYSHIGTYSKALSGLDNIAYTLTYWLKSGTTWTPQTIAVPALTTGTYTISINTNGASTQVDDVRFYPAGAQMVTYTYTPILGVTSTTDTKGEVSYYDYDTFQRLLNVKDKDGNVIKHLTYHYQGQ